MYKSAIFSEMLCLKIHDCTNINWVTVKCIANFKGKVINTIGNSRTTKLIPERFCHLRKVKVLLLKPLDNIGKTEKQKC